MPLLLHEYISDTIILGVWKIDEQVEELKERLDLSEPEEEYFHSVKNVQRKKHWLGIRVLLNELIKSGSPEVVYDIYGKPYLKDDRRHISVSHSGDLAAVILSENIPMGIDVEKIRDRIERVVERFLSATEISSIGVENRLEKLYVCWGAKESMYKVAGTPDADFLHDMKIGSFDYLCEGTGLASAEMTTSQGTFCFSIHYRKINDYMLTWVLQKPGNDEL